MLERFFLKGQGRRNKGQMEGPREPAEFRGSQGILEKGLSSTCLQATSGPRASRRPTGRGRYSTCHSTSSSCEHSLPFAHSRVASCPADSCPKTWKQEGCILLDERSVPLPCCGIRS